MSVNTIPNFIAGLEQNSSSDRFLPITCPHNAEILANVPLSTLPELESAIESAAKAQKGWGATPIKDRVQVLFRFKTLIEENSEALARLVTQENGKTHAEALGSILRAVECVEFATSLPQIAPGQVLDVSRGVECKMIRQPLGVVAGITPFNFPFMVPLWMIPVALASGNSFILKPSEQTPLSALEIAKYLKQSGLPDGVFSVVHGDAEIVTGICDNPDIKAIGFIGSSKVAKIVYERGSRAGKRVRALGGAKNHLVLVPDADPEMAAENIVASVTGCAGQRCMAASVLLAVGEVDHILDKIQDKMAKLVPGDTLGPVISAAALKRITGYIERAKEHGLKVLLDGRSAKSSPDSAGYYIGASMLETNDPNHESACDEIFGPVLTVIRCDTLDQAIKIENNNPYGNAAAIYTSSGKAAQHFSEHAAAGMIGVNIGVPVPREPFGFGGWHASRFGDGDLTGPSAIDFWSAPKKITTKWSQDAGANWMS